jgi:Telomeric single stranded DNA binding POT1/CDC13
LWKKLTSHQISCGSTQLAFLDFKIQQEAASGVNGVSRDQSITYTNSKTPSPPISSPIFSTSKRQSASSFVDASLDPFAEDDGFIVGKGRKRTKFARHSGAWKLLDDTFLEQDNENTIESRGDGEAVEVVDSSSGSGLTEQTISAVACQADSLIARNRSHWGANRDRLPQVDLTDLAESSKREIFDFNGSGSVEDEVDARSEQSLNPNIASADTILMAPPITPIRRAPLVLPKPCERDQAEVPTQNELLATTTPRLLPLPSPGLPLVSPLIQRHGAMPSYFPQFTSATSELDASGAQPLNEELGVIENDGAVNFDLSMPLTSPERLAEVALRDRGKQEDDSSSLQPLLDGVHSGSGESAPVLPDLGPNTTMTTDETGQAQSSRNIDVVMNEWAQSFPECESQSIPLQGAPEFIEDEDMYGPSNPQVGTEQSDFATPNAEPTKTSALEVQETLIDDSEKSPVIAPQVSTDWQEKLTISAVDSQAEAVIIYPPSPFVQGQDKAYDNRTRTLACPPSLDGANDQMDEDEVLGLGSEPEEANSRLESLADETEIIPSPIERDQPLGARGAGEAGGPGDDATAHLKHRSPQLQFDILVDGQVLTVDRSTAEDKQATLHSPSEALDLTQKPSTVAVQHLLTPANTQQDIQDENDQMELNRWQGHAMPMTPQNTQEKLESHLPKSPPQSPDQALADSPMMESAIGPSLPSSPTTRRTSQRLSRKSLPLEDLSAISSPYFTPRWSERVPIQPPSSPTRKESITQTEPNSTFPSPNQIIKAGRKRPASSSGEPAGPVHLPTLESRPSGLTTSLSYFTPLAMISEYFFLTVDILAVCHSSSTDPQRAKLGPKNFYCTLQLVDSSLEVNMAVIAQIFRPNKFALPSTRQGDVVLLRNVKVQSHKRKFMLLSTDTSAWAVFAHPEHSYSSASTLAVKQTGPPIEYGPEERTRAIEQMQWWDEEGLKRFPLPIEHSEPRVGLRRDLTGQPDPGSTEPPVTRSSARHHTDHPDKGDEDNHSASLDLPLPTHSRRQSDTSILSQPPQRAKRVGARNRRSESVIHELRDGTTWIDEDQSTLTRSRRSRRSTSLIHELRDGVTWIDE